MAAEVTRPNDFWAGRRNRIGIGAAAFDEVIGTVNGTLLLETSPKAVLNTLCWRVMSTLYNFTILCWIHEAFEETLAVYNLISELSNERRGYCIKQIVRHVRLL